MDDDRALAQLPTLSRSVLRRHRAGATAAEIAEQLAIEPESVASLIELAEAKLARLRCAQAGP